MPTWPDIEAVILRRLLPALNTPEDIETRGRVRGGTHTDRVEHGPFVRVEVLGGTDNGFTDSARIDVDAFAPTREQAMDLAMQVRQAMLAMAATAEPDGSDLIDTVRTNTRPTPMGYRDSDVERVLTGYTVETRLQ